MQRHDDNLAGRVNGVLTPLFGVSVTVTDDATGKPAALYSDNGVTPITTAITTDEQGYYGFYAANGTYTITFISPQIATFTRKIELYDQDDDPPLTQAQAAAPTAAGTIGGTWFGNVVATVAQLGTSIGASLIGFIQAGAGAVARSIQDRLRETYSVKDFGAKGDGTTNDTAAFQAAAAAINAAGGGKLVIPLGTYIVGQQTFAGATGKGYAYQAADILKITGCTNPVIIESHGAVLRVAAGLKFGSFDPVTGLAYTPGSLPFTNADYSADVGNVLSLTNNAGGVSILGRLEIDGNNTNLALGGQWGDTGYQRIAYGINETGNASFYAENVYVHHNATDNISCGYSGAAAGDPKRPKTLVNVVCEYSGRNNLSWIGGIGLTAINCKFNSAGKAVNTGLGYALASSPSAGVDIEAESAVIRGGTFINCEMANNNGCGMVSDSGDSADIDFIDCKLYGISNYAAWPNKPRVSFTRCLIAGGLVNAYNATDDKDRTRFNQCTFSGDEVWNGVSVAYNALLADVTGQNCIFSQCSFSTKNVNVKLPASTVATYIDCYFLQNGSTGTAVTRGNFQGRNTLTITTGSVDMNGAYNYGEILYNGSGPLNLGQSSISPAYGYIKVFGSNGATYQTNLITSTYQKPTSGTATRGDMVLNNMPSVGGPDFWRCVTGGSPGTWVPNKKRGTFTCSAASATTVTDTDVQASSLILLMPKNAAAATLMGGATALYVSARTAATSFAVTTANGAAAAGTEQFEYELLN